MKTFQLYVGLLQPIVIGTLADILINQAHIKKPASPPHRSQEGSGPVKLSFRSVYFVSLYATTWLPKKVGTSRVLDLAINSISAALDPSSLVSSSLVVSPAAVI